MSALAPTLQAFFTDRLIAQRRSSPRTIASYRDTMRLLLQYAQARMGRPPAELDIADLDAELITAFLDHLEHDRHNTIGTRNTRPAAIRSLFRYASLRHPEHAALIARVLAIPPKRHDRTIITHLTKPEITALLAAPDTSTWIGRRDRAMLQVAIESGLRVSELTGLTIADTHLPNSGSHVACHGKGRKNRITPLTKTTAGLLREWLRERAGLPIDPVFPTTCGAPLTRDAVARRLTLHASRAALSCPTLASKNVTPHVLCHTAAMRLLHAGVDTTVIALWLGHENVETTRIYLDADLATKEQALARTAPPAAKPGRFKPPDTLLAFLQGLRLSELRRPTIHGSSGRSPHNPEVQIMDRPTRTASGPAGSSPSPSPPRRPRSLRRGWSHHAGGPGARARPGR